MHTLSPNFLLVFPKETSQRLISSLSLTSVDNFRHTNLAILESWWNSAKQKRRSSGSIYMANQVPTKKRNLKKCQIFS